MSIYKLSLHESAIIGGNIVIRVPGGWIYLIPVGLDYTSVFVPWQSPMEFVNLMEDKKDKG